MHSQLQHSHLRSVHGLHLHVRRMVHERLGDRFDKFLHWAPPLVRDSQPKRDQRARTTEKNKPPAPGNGAPGEAEDAQKSGGLWDYAIFCRRRKLRPVSLGWAPRPIQYLMRSASSLISAGFFSGSYVPTASFTRPSRGRVLSMTTTR